MTMHTTTISNLQKFIKRSCNRGRTFHRFTKTSKARFLIFMLYRSFFCQVYRYVA